MRHFGSNPHLFLDRNIDRRFISIWPEMLKVRRAVSMLNVTTLRLSDFRSRGCCSPLLRDEPLDQAFAQLTRLGVLFLNAAANRIMTFGSNLPDIDRFYDVMTETAAHLQLLPKAAGFESKLYASAKETRRC